MFEGMRLSQSAVMLKRIPRSLPIHILAGEDDPIHRKGAESRRLRNITKSD